jgi:hypothetical protein
MGAGALDHSALVRALETLADFQVAGDKPFSQAAE